VPFSQGLRTWSEAQRTARPWRVSAASGTSAYPVPTPTGKKPILDQTTFRENIDAYGKGDLNSFDRLVTQLTDFNKQGGNADPYVRQIFGRNLSTIAVVIKTYKGTDRDEGQRRRAEWLRQMGALEPTLDGLLGLQDLWAEVLPLVQQAA